MPGVAGRSGRRAKPTAQKLLAGNPGKRQLNKDEPDFGLVTNIDPPDWVTAEARDMWERVVPLLCAQGVLQSTDIQNVEAYCFAYQNMRRAQMDLSNNGTVVCGATGGPTKNPAATVFKESVGVMATYGALLGLDPSSRARLLGAGKKKGENPFGNLLGK
jgi:P27 family predicted phage terminase small subunit